MVKSNPKLSPSRYEYDVTQPMLPHDATSPFMDYPQMTDWLNHRARSGWDLVTYGQTRWSDGVVQGWWVFRRLKEPSDAPDVRRSRPPRRRARTAGRKRR